ncbi:hypothetical protein ACWGH3_30685 [Streptomyces sp. NPDC054884]|uniref:hypothetical protein n=1 Tax=Streptomyces sp. ME08-AFT2 TaxID=3028683 RepID=UPI0029AE034F|nr:hypothetical protein [Streptomyces sp. ME08-AFT2]MDX3314293.1 hypothetical protein [Streptomyces sp. ME08-AFT2]
MVRVRASLSQLPARVPGRYVPDSRSDVVRPFPGEGVRVTVGLPTENDALPALAASRRG